MTDTGAPGFRLQFQVERALERGYEALVRSLILALLGAIVACKSTSEPLPGYDHDVTAEMVTGAALAALRSDGRFNIEQPATTTSQVSLQVAQSQSHEFARWVTNQLLLRGVVEAERGGFWTDPHLLTACRDAHFVHAQLASTIADSLAGALQVFQRSYGPQWLVPMCGAEDDPQMTVQIAVNENDIRFANGDPVQPYSLLTRAWYARGVPLNWPDPLPLSAERAVRFVWETFGVRVTDVPQLYFRGDLDSNNMYLWYQIGSTRVCNRWRVMLENDVTLRGASTQQQVTTRVLWIASVSCSNHDVDPVVQLPLASQPSAVTVDLFDESVSPIKRWTFEVPVVAPIRFEIGNRGP